MSTIYLAGGGPGAALALRRHFRAALALVPHEPARVAYVGAASRDDRSFFTMIRGALAAAGAKFEMARVAGAKDKASEARSLLQDADLIFMSGGDVELGMNLLEDKGVAATLRELGEAGKPMFGVSAGSLMLAREWVRFVGEDESQAEIFPCLGVAPVHVDAHSEDDGWSELRILVGLLHDRGDEKPVGYGLTRKGALVVDPRGRDRVRPLGTPIPRIVVRRGVVADGDPLPP